jgi:hypothetical protein
MATNYRNDFLKYMKEGENAALLKGSKNAELLHKSPEGGTPTFGYGYKLTEKEWKEKKIKGVPIENLTLDDAERLLKEALTSKENIVKKRLSEGWKDPATKKIIKVDYNSLSDNQKEMLLDYEYNLKGGLTKFPSFVAGVLTNDYDRMNKEYQRGYTTGDGEFRPLKARNKLFSERYLQQADTPAPQFNNLPPIGSGSTYSMTPQQMESQVYPPSISDAPYPEVSDRYKMELLSKPNVNSPDGVKRVQAQIGADVDGIWGKQSQDLFDMHNRQAYDNKVRPPSDTYRQEGFQGQAPRNPSLVERGVNAIVPSAQAAAMPVAPPEKQYMTMEELLIDKDLMQNPLLFNDADAKRMWETF